MVIEAGFYYVRGKTLYSETTRTLQNSLIYRLTMCLWCASLLHKQDRGRRSMSFKSRRTKRNTLHSTSAFSMHAQRAHAALDWTSALGFFSSDHTRGIPSSWSMILEKEKGIKVLRETRQWKKRMNRQIQETLKSVRLDHLDLSLRLISCLTDIWVDPFNHVCFSELYQPARHQAQHKYSHTGSKHQSISAAAFHRNLPSVFPGSFPGPETPPLSVTHTHLCVVLHAWIHK